MKRYMAHILLFQQKKSPSIFKSTGHDEGTLADVLAWKV